MTILKKKYLFLDWDPYGEVIHQTNENAENNAFNRIHLEQKHEPDH